MNVVISQEEMNFTTPIEEMRNKCHKTISTSIKWIVVNEEIFEIQKGPLPNHTIWW